MAYSRRTVRNLTNSGRRSGVSRHACNKPFAPAKNGKFLPGDAVVVAVVAGGAPEGAVLAIEQDGVHRPHGAFAETRHVAHVTQLLADPGRRGFVQQDVAGLRIVALERFAQLAAVEGRGLRRL